MRVHPDLEWARDQASRFLIRRSERGFHVWVFRPWDRPSPGWRILVPDVKSKVDGWLHVLAYLHLMKDDPPAPHPPAPRKARPVEDECW